MTGYPVKLDERKSHTVDAGPMAYGPDEIQRSSYDVSRFTLSEQGSSEATEPG